MVCKGCSLEKYAINQENNLVPEFRFGDRSCIGHLPCNSTIRVSLEFVAHSLETRPFAEVNKKISSKKVKDCSVEELFFAIRNKIKH